MAKAFPRSEFVGYDFHAPSIEEARRHAEEHGLAGRVRFEVAAAKEIAERGFDLVTMYDCLHDMGDPRGRAVHMREILAPDGTWMVVEPMAGDRPEHNMNPVGRLFYNGSTMICVPTSLDQEVGEGLGAQAGEAKLAGIIREGDLPPFAERLRDRSIWCWRRISLQPKRRSEIVARAFPGQSDSVGIPNFAEA